MQVPVRFVVFGDGEVGFRLTQYACEFSDFFDQVAYVEKEAGPFRDVTNRLDVPLYASDPAAYDAMKEAGNNPAGTLADLPHYDIAIDATDGQVYFRGKVPGFTATAPLIGQGSLKDGFDVSVSSLVNLSAAAGKRRPRKVSCNTTAASRVIGALRNQYGLSANADGFDYEISLFRRTANYGADGQVDNMSFNTDPKTQHHAHDIDLVFGDAIGAKTHGKSAAYEGCHTRGHIQRLRVYLGKAPGGKEELLELFQSTPRITLVQTDDVAKAANQFSRSGRFMGDFPENAVVADSVAYNGGSNSVDLVQIVDNVSIVVPENLDMMLRMCTDLADKEIIREVDRGLSTTLLPGFFKMSARY